jgi:hypothetical protein
MALLLLLLLQGWGCPAAEEVASPKVGVQTLQQ